MRDEMKKGHILYVEDDDLVRRSTTRVLERAGYDVWACPDVETAKRGLKAFAFDCVVSDWQLGFASTGADVYALVKEHQPALALRFLFLSGHEPKDHKAVPWMEKPATAKQLLRFVDELMRLARLDRQTDVRGSAL